MNKFDVTFYNPSATKTITLMLSDPNDETRDDDDQHIKESVVAPQQSYRHIVGSSGLLCQVDDADDGLVVTSNEGMLNVEAFAPGKGLVVRKNDQRLMLKPLENGITEAFSIDEGLRLVVSGG